MTSNLKRRTLISLPIVCGIAASALTSTSAQEQKTHHKPEYDVIVVGGGYSGLSAAVAASRDGAKVLLIEKRGRTGGDGAISGGVFQTYRTPLHDKQDVTKNVGPEDYWNRFAKGLDDEPLQKVRDNTPNSPIYDGINKHNPEVIKKAALMSPEVMKFVMDYGIEFMQVNPNMPFRIAMVAGEPAKFAAAMLNELKERNVEIMRNTRVQSLIMDDGRVVGVEAERKKRSKTFYLWQERDFGHRRIHQ